MSHAPFPFPYDGDPALRGPIEAALREVIDPELGLSVVDLGLIYGVSVGEARVRILMTMTSAACPVVDDILDEAERELDPVIPPEYHVDLELCWDPPWGPERLSEHARLLMGW